VANDDDVDVYSNYWVVPLKGVKLSLTLPPLAPSPPLPSVAVEDRPVIGFGVQRKGEFTFGKDSVYPLLFGDPSRISGEVVILVRWLDLEREREKERKSCWRFWWK
jgi:hypothetical protein